MSGQWISHWIDTLATRNELLPAGRKLRSDFEQKYPKSPMVAAVVRVNPYAQSGQIKFAAQKYVPQKGQNMKAWGDIAYG